MSNQQGRCPTSSLSEKENPRPMWTSLDDITNVCLRRSDLTKDGVGQKTLPSLSTMDIWSTPQYNHKQGLPVFSSSSAIQSCISTLEEQSKMCSREQYSNMSAAKKETYLKRRHQNYHKRKALMASSSTQSNLSTVVEGLHVNGVPVDSSPATPEIVNVGTQLFQSPIDFSLNVCTQLFESPMDVSQISHSV